MERFTLDLPAMYGDHHVIEVRRILLELPGVEEVYASSGFHYVEVMYDPARVHLDDLTTCLEKAGYLGALSIPVETGAKAYQSEDNKPYIRHTSVLENVKSVVSFTQSTGNSGRPLWPCPGVGPIRTQKEEE